MASFEGVAAAVDGAERVPPVVEEGRGADGVMDSSETKPSGHPLLLPVLQLNMGCLSLRTKPSQWQCLN